MSKVIMTAVGYDRPNRSLPGYRRSSPESGHPADLPKGRLSGPPLFLPTEALCALGPTSHESELCADDSTLNE